MSAKRLILIGFILTLLITIPVLIWFLGQQQQQQSKAQKSTILSFSPESQAATPIEANVGDSVKLDVMINPGTNLVSFLRLVINYDQSKFATLSATEGKSFENNAVAFPVILEGPIFTPGKISVTLSVGSDPTKVVQATTKAATVTLKALATTADVPTQVSYGNQANETQVLSIASSDQASEDVLSSVLPAFVKISAALGESTPTPTGEPGTTVTPSITPSTTATPTLTPTLAPNVTVTPTASPTPGIGAANQAPVCTNLVADRSTTGAAPFSIALTADGTDSDGTINKVTFNFGDGPVQDVTQTGGIGTNTVSTQVAHTYNAAGTYQATAVVTDDKGTTSVTGSCSLTVTVTGSSGTTTSGGTTAVAPTAEPTVAATGPGTALLSVGALIGILTIVGGLLFILL